MGEFKSLKGVPLTHEALERLKTIGQHYAKSFPDLNKETKTLSFSHRKSLSTPLTTRPFDVLFEELQKDVPNPLAFEPYFCCVDEREIRPKKGAISFLESVFNSLLLLPDTEDALKALSRAKYASSDEKDGRVASVYSYYVFGNLESYMKWRKGLKPSFRFPKEIRAYALLYATRAQDTAAGAPEQVRTQFNDSGFFEKFTQTEECKSLTRVFHARLTRYFEIKFNLSSDARLDAKRAFLLHNLLPFLNVERLQSLFQRDLAHAMIHNDTRDIRIFCELPKGNLHRPTLHAIQVAFSERMQQSVCTFYFYDVKRSR